MLCRNSILTEALSHVLFYIGLFAICETYSTLSTATLYHNNNLAIISEELFESAQAEKLSRSKKPEHELTMSL